MRRAELHAALLAIAAFTSFAAPARAAEVLAPKPVVRTLENGMRIAVFQNGRLPIVRVQLMVAAGIADEPGEALGVASLVAELLRSGTTSRDPREAALAVDALGGNLTSSAHRDYSALTGGFLARDLDAGLELMADAAIQPVFPTAELERLERQAMGTLQAGRRNPALLAEEHANAMAFGAHPYARPVLGTKESLPAVGVDQVRAFHRDFYRPDGALLVIAGDVEPERAFELARARFGGWAGKRKASAAGVPPVAPKSPRVRLIDVPGAQHAEVRVAWLAPGRRDADALALSAAVDAWGGAATGKRLASLGARRAFLAPPSLQASFQREAGVVMAGAPVRLDSIGAAVRALDAQIRGFGRDALSSDETGRTLRRLAAAANLSYETLAGLAGGWLSSEASGVTWDETSRTAERLAALTPEAIAGAASQWLGGAGACWVIAGPAEKIRPRLQGWRELEVVAADAPVLTVKPRPAALTTAPSPAEIARGREVVARAVSAHGGLDKLRTIKDSTVDGDAFLLSDGRELTGAMKQVRKEPHRLMYTTDFFTFQTYQVLDGAKGWARTGGGATLATEVQDLDSTQVAALRFAFSSDVPHLLLAASDPTARIAYRGQETISGKPADVVECVPVGGPSRVVLFVDPEHGHLVAMEQNEGEASAGRFARRVYQDFRSVQGIAWPFYEERLQDGQRLMRFRAKQVQINTGVPDDTFKRPETP
jgi:predicted Zn-dependent peptidase